MELLPKRIFGDYPPQQTEVQKRTLMPTFEESFELYECFINVKIIFIHPSSKDTLSNLCQNLILNSISIMIPFFILVRQAPNNVRTGTQCFNFPYSIRILLQQMILEEKHIFPYLLYQVLFHNQIQNQKQT